MLLNETMDHIGEKLSFGLPVDQIEATHLLYKADSFILNETVSVNCSNRPAQVDINLLFNAATTNPTGISQIFTQQNK